MTLEVPFNTNTGIHNKFQPLGAKRRKKDFIDRELPLAPLNGTPAGPMHSEYPTSHSEDKKQSKHEDVPTIVISEALQSLDGWLSSTAIDSILARFVVTPFRIIDSGWVCISNPATIKPVRLKSHEEALIIPIWHTNHWTLAVIYLEERKILHYNSLPPTAKEIPHALMVFAERLTNLETLQTNSSWSYTEEVCRL